MKITLYDTQNDLKINEKSVSSLAKEVLDVLDISTDEVIINFVDCQKIQNLHEEFFNDPSITDCITFPIDGTKRSSDNYHVLGEVFVCPKVAMQTLPHDPYEETSVYLVHTLLHLAGYEDTKPELKNLMDIKQNELVNAIKSKNLLLTN